MQKWDENDPVLSKKKRIGRTHHLCIEGRRKEELSANEGVAANRVRGAVEKETLGFETKNLKGLDVD